MHLNIFIKSLLLCICAVSLHLALALQQEGSRELDAFLAGPGPSLTPHVVHLRTGLVDVGAEHQGLPPLTPRARQLLAHPSPAPTRSPGWGPLSGAQLWILTLGPELHHHEQAAAFDDPGAPTDSTAGFLPPTHIGEQQSALLQQLSAAGCAVVSFLPPAAWLVAVGAGADLAPLLAAQPHVRIAPYRPGSRVSPELREAVGAVERGGAGAAARLAGGERLDAVVGRHKFEGPVGAMQLHRPRRPAAVHTAAAAGSSSTQELRSGSAQDAPEQPRVVIEVHFPHLEEDDLAHLAAGMAADPSSATTTDSTASSSSGGDSASPGAYHPASAAAADWAGPLSALSPATCPPTLQADPHSPAVLLVGLCAEALPAAVQWLAAAPVVQWLAPRLAARVHNLVAGAIIQTGGSGAAVASTVAAHPFWAAGLDGRGQIIGCGDSGLDMDNCYFADPAVPFRQGVRTDASGFQFFASSTHRKVAYYLALQDLTDTFGHGTHVSGTLVGSRYDRPNATSGEPLDPATGQAPAARLAFMDLSRGTSDGVLTPADLGRGYFNLTYRVGARVHSDSWGSDLTAYDGMASQVDRFMWNNQDFVSVFAAGNYGTSTGASTTVTSPAVSKNCISAGATFTMDRSRYSLPSAVFNMVVTVQLLGGQRFTRTVRVTGLGDLSALPVGTALAAAAPADACGALTNGGAARGAVLLAQRGGCSFADKARQGAAAGALAVVVFNDRQDGYFALGATDGAAVPLAGVPASTGRWLGQALAAGDVSVAFRVFRSATAAPNAFDDVAYFSSFGPTADGRIKPDVVAPGFLISARSDGSLAPDGSLSSCDAATATKELQGTSMATPAVAGSAALVRQYFQDGFHPGGERAPGQGFAPSGALVKAVLLGGATHMPGYASSVGLPLEDVPSYRQGFGRLNLAQSLPLAGAANNGWRLQVVDGARLATGEQHRFCVQALGGPLRITLAWYDYWGDPAAARALVNNLDLQVRAAGRAGMVEYGNGAPDAVNTVEQVWYDDLAAGDVAISVSAPSVFVKAGRQPYALVVQGKFSGSLRAPSGNASSPSEATCAAQLAIIDGALSTESPTNRNFAKFFFSTQEGASPPNGFECALGVEGAAPAAPAPSTHNWTACSSPRDYTGLVDARYSFQVRVKGEQVAAIRPLVVDTTPPVTTLTTSMGPLPAGAAPAFTSPTDNATFAWLANEPGSTFNCYLAFANGPPGQTAPPRLRRAAVAGAAVEEGGASGAVLVNKWFACSSPLELLGLSFGDWALQVQAYDAAGNPERDPKAITLRVRYEPNVSYARLSSGPFGITASPALAYACLGITGAASPDTPPAEFVPGAGRPLEAALAAVDAAGGAASRRAMLTGAEIAALSWQPVTSAAFQLSAPRDGSYVAVVRPPSSGDSAEWGLAEVEVDTTPPEVLIIRRPGGNVTLGTVPVQSDPWVTITFGDAGPEGDIRRYFCRWQGPVADRLPDAAAPDAGATAYAPCSRSAQSNVTEGYWLFQVKGMDAAGNVGPAVAVPFRTDLAPPAITAAPPAYTNGSRLSWDFAVIDGPTGTGVVAVNCSLKWTYLVSSRNVTPGSAEWPAGWPAGSTAGGPLAGWQSPCPNPARYTLQEGAYLWSITAADGAGLRAAADHPIICDATPPVSRIFASALPPGRTLPSRVSIDFASSDKPDGSPSGIAQQLCRLDAVSAPPPVSPPPRPPSPPPPPAPPGSSLSSSTSPPAATSAPSAAAGQRRLAASAPSPRILNGSEITLGEWHACDPSGTANNVTYERLATGFYALRVRAVDRAGNAGEPTAPYFFAVDASLPIDGSRTVEVGGGGGNSQRTRRIIIGVLVLVGAVLACCVVVGVVVARRRALARKRAAAASAYAAGSAANGNGDGYHANGNGNGYHANGYANSAIAMGTLPPYSNGGAASTNGGAAVAGVPALMVLPPSSGGGAASYYPVGVAPGLPVNGAAAAEEAALAAALAASAAEAERQRASAAAARAAAEEEERMRRAIAASLEEEQLRRAREASKAAAQSDAASRAAADRAAERAAEQAALDAAIAASLATQQAEAARQHAALRAQLQQQQGQGKAGGGGPSAPVFRPPDDSLI